MFGPHVSRVHRGSPGEGQKRPSILEHIRAARAAAARADFDARAFQIFVAGPRSLAITLRDEEARELRAFVDAPRPAGGPPPFIVAHGAYADYPWSGKPFIAKSIRRELRLCAAAGLAGLVIHLGRQPAAEVVKILPALLRGEKGGDRRAAALPGPGALIYLETPHLKPEHSHYETPEKLGGLFRAVRAVDPGLCHFGLCIDTAHLWSSGVDLRAFDAAEAWLRRLEAVADVIPPGRIMLHLNDSFSDRGSGLDRHAPLLGGLMWKAYRDRPQQSGLAAFVDFAVRHSVPTILERKPPEALLDDYAAIERLAPGAVRADLRAKKRGGAQANPS